MTSQPTARPMSGETMDRRDIIEKLLDFDRCGLTPGTRVNLRECAAIEIMKLRGELAKARDVIRPFAYYYDLNDCDDRKPDDALEVPISDLRAARAFLEEK